MPKIDRANRATGPERPRTKSGGVSALAPPLALAAVILAAAIPVWASAGGAASWQSGADGFFFNTYGPNPNVGNGVRSFTMTRSFMGDWNTMNSVGFYVKDAPNNRKLAYQVQDSRGNYIYWLTSPVYNPGDQVSAGMWRNSGTSWHFHWWGPNFNVGVNATNDRGYQANFVHFMEVNGWGGCPNDHPVNDHWYWIWRNSSNGGWNYFSDSFHNVWGDTPTYAVVGGANWGGTLAVGTVSCP